MEKLRFAFLMCIFKIESTLPACLWFEKDFTDLKYEDEYDDKLALNFWKVRIF